MDRATLRDAIYQLESLSTQSGGLMFASPQSLRQFNALLGTAKSLYPNRTDIQSLEPFDRDGDALPPMSLTEYGDAVRRLRTAVSLRPIGSAEELFSQIQLPEDAPEDLHADMRELEQAIAYQLHKTVLLLAGSIAEAFLLSRHPDNSERGPGMSQMVNQARTERVFGRETLRNLETLLEYRDMIHPRAEQRNQTFRNDARVETAVTALKLLCSELHDPDARYN